MTARSQKLYHVTLPDGEKRYVIEDDLPQLLSEHPELDPENRAHMYVYRGEDPIADINGATSRQARHGDRASRNARRSLRRDRGRVR